MIIVIVTFNISHELDSNALKDKFVETSPIYQKTKGLIRKNYISDLENGVAGGVYCFDTIQNAKNWFDPERIDWISKRYSKPTVKFFDSPVIVDNDKGQILS